MKALCNYFLDAVILGGTDALPPHYPETDPEYSSQEFFKKVVG